MSPLTETKSGSLPQRASFSILSRVALCVALVSLGACAEQAQPLGPWSATSWVIGTSLLDPTSDLTELGDHVSDQAKRELRELSRHAKAEGRLGLVDLCESSPSAWRGLYMYSQRSTLLGVEVEVTRRQGGWSLQSLPHLKTYRGLIDLAQTLPVSEGGAPWGGGLIGRDSRGRSLSAVPLALTAHGGLIDGFAIPKVTQAEVSRRLGEAFKQRQEVARIAQASYTPHVTLAVTASTPISRLIELIDWAEGAGAEEISLLTREIKGGLSMIYLAERVEASRLSSPQRLILGHVGSGSVKLSLKPDQMRSRKRAVKEPRATVSYSSLSSQAGTARQPAPSDEIARYLKRARQRGQIHGLALTPTSGSDVADLVSLITLTRVMEPDLPITVYASP